MTNSPSHRRGMIKHGWAIFLPARRPPRVPGHPRKNPVFPWSGPTCSPAHFLPSGFPLSESTTVPSQGFFLAVSATREALSHAFSLPSGQLNPDYVSINYFLKIGIQMRNSVSEWTVRALYGDRWQLPLVGGHSVTYRVVQSPHCAPEAGTTSCISQTSTTRKRKKNKN